MNRKLRDKLLARAREGARESRNLEFKEEFDPRSNGQWCEILKDIVAMANSGGGVIVFGVRNNGDNLAFDAERLERLDPADVTNKIASYTDHQFSNFELLMVRRRRSGKVAMLVGPVREAPLVFSREGGYRTAEGRDKTAFHKGTVYARHGAKSEPANESDLRGLIDREVKRLRDSWLSGIRKVTAAPSGSVVQVVHGGVLTSENDATPVRIVGTPDAPEVRPADGDVTWPYTATQVFESVNNRLAGRTTINLHDVICVQKVYALAEQHPDLMYRPFANGAARYSEACVDWFVERFEAEPNFFQNARREYKEMHHPQRE